jgi:hypothetical protein
MDCRKRLREHSEFNVTGVVITTTHETNGIFLPADDRRHYVGWSDFYARAELSTQARHHAMTERWP